MKIDNLLLMERIKHLELKEYSENTIGNYFTDVKLFLEFLKNEKGVSTVEIEEITLVEIDKRKRVLSETLTPRNSIYYAIRPTLSTSTIQSKLTSIKSLLKYLNFYYDVGLDYRKIETKKIKSDYIESLTDEEFRMFFNFIGDYEKYKINSLRMQLLCNIGYTSGLRLSEMLGLTVEQIKTKEIKIKGKGNKMRWVFFTPSTLDILDRYLEEREKPTPWTGKECIKSKFAFVSHNEGRYFGTPVKKSTICERMKKYSDAINLGKRITVHSLRHSYATRLLESGMNIREIQELLGHKDIQTTENYCHVLKSNLSKKVGMIFS